MKHILFLLALLMTGSLYSQNCEDGFYPVKNGASWETTNYNEADKVLGKVTSTISSVTKTAKGFKAVITTKSEDAKGKETSGTLDVECSGNVVMMDMKNFFNEQMKAYQGMKDISMEFTGSALEIPSKLSVGDSIKSGSLTMTVKSKDVVMATVIIDVYDRKVLAKEEVTVPAGKFMCYKIAYKTRFTNMIMNMPMKTEMEGTEWLSQRTGVVKSETYSKGKKRSYSLLTKINN